MIKKLITRTPLGTLPRFDGRLYMASTWLVDHENKKLIWQHSQKFFKTLEEAKEYADENGYRLFKIEQDL